MKLRLRVLLARPGAVGARRPLVVSARSSCHRTLYFVCASFFFSSLFRWCFVRFVGPPTRSSSCRQRAVYFVRIDLFVLASLSLFVLHVRRQRFCLLCDQRSFESLSLTGFSCVITVCACVADLSQLFLHRARSCRRLWPTFFCVNTAALACFTDFSLLFLHRVRLCRRLRPTLFCVNTDALACVPDFGQPYIMCCHRRARVCH